MMKAYRWLFCGLLMLLGSVVHAEGECPPGMFPTNPAGTQGPVGCAPIPGYSNNRQQAQPQPPPAEWLDRWGAIATDGANGSLGAATNMSSLGKAEQAAMIDCRSKGGTKCKVDVSYGNGCAALVAGSTGYAVHNAATLNEAIRLATTTCSSGDADCHVVYSACSMPVRIQ